MKRPTVILLAFFLGNLLLRLLLIRWHTAEYTDGVRMMSAEGLAGKWLPAYPLLIRLFAFILRDLELSGRVVASLSGAAAVFPLYLLGRRIFGERCAWETLLLYSVLAAAHRWSLHVMTETTFALFFLLFVWGATLYLLEQRRPHLVLATVYGACASVTRPEGVAALPVVLLLHGIQLRREGARASLPAASSLVSWAMLPLWSCLVSGGFLYGAELSGSAEAMTAGKCLTFAVCYLDSFPYVLGYPLFPLFLAGVYQATVTGKERYVGLVIYLAGAWLVALSVHWAWSTRFLYPLVLLSLTFVPAGLRMLEARLFPAFRTSALVLCLLYGVAFTALVLWCQRDTFGDIRRVALYLKENPPKATIHADEPRKTMLWSGLHVELYDRERLQPGAFLALHSFYTDLAGEWTYLNDRFKLRRVYQSQSTIVPILGDDLIQPYKELRFTDTPYRFSCRFSRQRFESVVVELGPRKDP